jgi:tripartite-type tricarboxylate transporter receptor subunit TctC
MAPDLPTLTESIVPGYDFAAWYVLLAPGATPLDVLTLLNRELVAALQTQEVKDQFLAIGLTVQPDSLARTRDRLARDFTKWEAVAKAAGMSAK